MIGFGKFGMKNAEANQERVDSAIFLDCVFGEDRTRRLQSGVRLVIDSKLFL